MDDLTASLSILLLLISWSLVARATEYGMGRHNVYVSIDDQIKAKHLAFSVQPLWSWSVILAKISMACMLLRIMRPKPWRIFLYVIIGIQLTAGVGFMAVILAQCRPLSGLWNPQPDSKCWSPTVMQVALYVTGVVSIITDFIFTLMPFTFISKMNLPLRQKIVLGSLMGLGLFATAAGIVKMTLIRTYTHGTDTLYGMIGLYLWGFLEQEMTIVALCVPCLKAPFEKVLRRLKLVSSSGGRSNEQGTKTRSGYIAFGGSRSNRSEVGHEMSEMRSKGGKGDVETQSQETILPMKDGTIMKTTETEVKFETPSSSVKGDER